MVAEYNTFGNHDRFKELSALANTGILSATEWVELKEHLALCEDCRQIHNEYLLLDREGMPMLASALVTQANGESWDSGEARARLTARIEASEQTSLPIESAQTAPHFMLFRDLAGNRFAQAFLAACLILTISFLSYRAGNKAESQLQTQVQVQSSNSQQLASRNKALTEELDKRKNELSVLGVQLERREAEGRQQQEEIAQLRAAVVAQNVRLDDLTKSASTTTEQLNAALAQRDSLTNQLHAAYQAYEAVRAELTALRTERDKAVLQVASTDSRMNELLSSNRDLTRRLRDQQQYLESDRDIRELMGARQLYIADVYDIDSSSRTRKPFGRVFYTQGKSLIFYAFDLDREPGVKDVNDNAFQVWGRRNSDQGAPRSLGILYQDNVANRRWVLRTDDPKQLAEINAVFVTVEPSGGSEKPTGKPFLYALLRKEANHP